MSASVASQLLALAESEDRPEHQQRLREIAAQARRAEVAAAALRDEPLAMWQVELGDRLCNPDQPLEGLSVTYAPGHPQVLSTVTMVMEGGGDAFWRLEVTLEGIQATFNMDDTWVRWVLPYTQLVRMPHQQNHLTELPKASNG